MKWPSYHAADVFRKCQGPVYAAKHKVVKTRYWSCDLWTWVPCYTVVMK